MTKLLIDRALLEQALETLENDVMQRTYAGGVRISNAAIALRAALAQEEPACCCGEPSAPGIVHRTDGPCYMAEPVQEPVARVIDDETPEGSTEWIPYSGRQVPVKTGDLLYTHPPRREWKGLTEEEMKSTCANTWSYDPYMIARAIEASLKEKNHE
jgi:hypothetical protein